MEKSEILSHIDHTLLKPVSTWEQIQEICETGLEKNTASVCIPPAFVERAHEAYPDLNICTVIGFPLGYNTTAVKAFEAKDALEKGANEIDMVINIGALKEGDLDYVEKEIKTLKDAVGDHILKVIVETCYLDDDEKKKVCKAVTDAGADFIKTSTGFGTGGATREDIMIFKDNIGDGVKMKAAGGVKTREDLEDFLELGCERIGTSSAVSMLEEE